MKAIFRDNDHLKVNYEFKLQVERPSLVKNLDFDTFIPSVTYISIKKQT